MREKAAYMQYTSAVKDLTRECNGGNVDGLPTLTLEPTKKDTNIRESAPIF